MWVESVIVLFMCLQRWRPPISSYLIPHQLQPHSSHGPRPGHAGPHWPTQGRTEATDALVFHHDLVTWRYHGITPMLNCYSYPSLCFKCIFQCVTDLLYLSTYFSIWTFILCSKHCRSNFGSTLLKIVWVLVLHYVVVCSSLEGVRAMLAAAVERRRCRGWRACSSHNSRLYMKHRWEGPGRSAHTSMVRSCLGQTGLGGGVLDFIMMWTRGGVPFVQFFYQFFKVFNTCCGIIAVTSSSLIGCDSDIHLSLDLSLRRQWFSLLVWRRVKVNFLTGLWQLNSWESMTAHTLQKFTQGTFLCT